MPVIVEGFPVEQLAEKLKKAVTLTKTMTDGEIDMMAKIAVVEEMQKDEIVAAEEETGNDIFLIAAGQIGIELKLNPDADSGTRIFKMGENGIVGEVSFIDGNRRSASIRIIAPTRMFRFPCAQLKALCAEQPAFGYKLITNLAILMAQRIRNTNIELRTHLYR